MSALTPPPSPPWRPGLVRRLAIRWARIRRWEFWPAWLFYVPIVLHIVGLGLRFRRPLAFTATNPGLDHGGVVGERKAVPLAALARTAPDLVARFERVEPGHRADPAGLAGLVDRIGGLPLVVKPDVGQRGRGVQIVRDGDVLRDLLAGAGEAMIVQRYIGGEEYGVFIYRHPVDGAAQVFSIVHKRFPTVTGDGVRTLLRLIHDDARARLIAPLLTRRLGADADRVPGRGVCVKLVEIGSHCRGAVFEDARALSGPGLVAAMQRVLDGIPGFHFGRLDLRCPSAGHLQRGEGLQILEVNGVTAEAAHVYHPGASLRAGYATLFRQWRIAFEIGSANARAGASTVAPLHLLRLFRDDLRRGATYD